MRASNKEQVATEFFMTYGWGIIIAVIVITILALIAFGVLNHEVQETCGTKGVIVPGVSFNISSIKIGPSGGNISVTNSLDSAVDFSVMSVTVKDGMTCSPTVNFGSIAAGTTGNIVLTCIKLTPGKVLDATFSGNYTVNSQTYPVTFTLVKKIHT